MRLRGALGQARGRRRDADSGAHQCDRLVIGSVILNLVSGQLPLNAAQLLELTFGGKSSDLQGREKSSIPSFGMRLPFGC